MKKIVKVFSSTLIIFLSVFMITGCGEKETNPNGSGGNILNPQNMPDTSKNSWETFYNTYSNISDVAYEKLNETTESFSILNFISGDIDLAFCSSFFTNNEAGVKMMFQVLGYENIVYNTASTVESVTGVLNGKQVEYKLEFDGKLAVFKFTDPDTANTLSIYIDGNKWAKSFSSNTMTVRIYQDGENIYFGYDDTGASEYVSADKLSKEAATSMPHFMQLENGTFSEY